jgi:hypothetical protein
VVEEVLHLVTDRKQKVGEGEGGKEKRGRDR